MNVDELEQCKRFKKLRTELNMKQGDFAKELTLSQGHVSDIENGRKTVSDQTIEILTLKFNVNENWLRTGEGEMFSQLDRQDQIANLTATLFKGEKNSFKERLILALAGLDENEWEILEKIAEKIAKEKD